jgi:hypothetical protein
VLLQPQLEEVTIRESMSSSWRGILTELAWEWKAEFACSAVYDRARRKLPFRILRNIEQPTVLN